MSLHEEEDTLMRVESQIKKDQGDTEEIGITNEFSYIDIIKISLKLGITSFGGLNDQTNLLKRVLVEKNLCVNKEVFDELTKFCVLLPGYSISNLVAAVFTLNKNNIFAGLLALLFFNLPAILMILPISAIIEFIAFKTRPIVTNYNPNGKYFTFHDQAIYCSLYSLAAGLVQAALGLLLDFAFNISRKLSATKKQFIFLMVSGGIYYANGSYSLMVIIMVFCGLISLIIRDENLLLDAGTKINATMKYSGFTSLLIFVFILLSFLLLEFFVNNEYFYLVSSFFKMGSITIGEGLVVVPMVLSQFKKLIEESEVLNGFALVTLLPGSLLNIACFTGVFIKNIIAGILCEIAIFLPGFLIMTASLPNILKFKTGNFEYFIRGANSAAVGFIFAASIKFWIDSCFKNKYTSDIIGTLNVIFCFVMKENYSTYKIHESIILIIGALINFNAEILRYITKNKSIKFGF